MPSDIDNITIGAIKTLNPQAYDSFFAHLATTYDDFIIGIYKKLELIISSLQENPQHQQGNSEAQITNQIVSMFRIAGYNAYSDTENGGHVDIKIDKPNTNFLWLAEAKKGTNLNHIHEGFLQLLTRYATGGINQTEGCILIYIFTESAVEHVQNFRDDLPKRGIDDLEINDSPCRNPLIFYSESHTPRMGEGIKYKVKHIGISLYFRPLDKSGRKAEKYK